jgi:hypothetical protein
LFLVWAGGDDEVGGRLPVEVHGCVWGIRLKTVRAR